MTNRPDHAWYLLDADTSAPTRLLTDEGRPEPALTSDAERALATRDIETMTSAAMRISNDFLGDLLRPAAVAPKQPTSRERAAANRVSALQQGVMPWAIAARCARCTGIR